MTDKLTAEQIETMRETMMDLEFLHSEDDVNALCDMALSSLAVIEDEVTEEMWGGLARDLVMWRDLQNPTGCALYRHLEACGREIPDWLREEIGDNPHVPPKGTVAVCIYKAMRALAPKPQQSESGAADAVMVPRAAIEWLIGLGDSFAPPKGFHGKYWWRSEFCRRAGISDEWVNAAAAPSGGHTAASTSEPNQHTAVAVSPPAADKGWIPVTPETMPEAGVPVIAYYKNALGKGRRIRAFYTPAKTIEDNNEYEAAEYDDQSDSYFLREGWYENNEHDEVNWLVDEPVTHWQPLPPSPDKGTHHAD